jgi:hypothetical protein
MLVLTFYRQARIDPILLSRRIISHVCITHRRQFTGGLFRGVSRGAGAIHYNLRIPLRQESKRQLIYLVWRQIDCTRQVRVLISNAGQCFDKKKPVFAINLLL